MISFTDWNNKKEKKTEEKPKSDKKKSDVKDN